MNVFIVTREGVYRHEMVGAYLDEQDARAAAWAAIHAEEDDYHSFHVTRMVIGEVGEHAVCKFRRRDDKEFDRHRKAWNILSKDVAVKEAE
jgi:hypothetical protein